MPTPRQAFPSPFFRTYESYRFGFNGKEKLDEMHGNSGDEYDFGDRICDSRICRWLTIDPFAGHTPWMSPYGYAKDNPIYLIDVGGDTTRTCVVVILSDGTKITMPTTTDINKIKTVYTVHSIDFEHFLGGESNPIDYTTSSDYDVTITYTVHITKGADGKETFSVDYDEFDKYRPGWLDWDSEGKDLHQHQPSGINFTSKDGGGVSPTKITATKDIPESTEIGDLLTALTVLGQGDVSIIGKTELSPVWANRIKDISNIVTDYKDLQEKIREEKVSMPKGSASNASSPKTTGDSSFVTFEGKYPTVESNKTHQGRPANKSDSVKFGVSPR